MVDGRHQANDCHTGAHQVPQDARLMDAGLSFAQICRHAEEPAKECKSASGSQKMLNARCRACGRYFSFPYSLLPGNKPTRIRLQWTRLSDERMCDHRTSQLMSSQAKRMTILHQHVRCKTPSAGQPVTVPFAICFDAVLAKYTYTISRSTCS